MVDLVAHCNILILHAVAIRACIDNALTNEKNLTQFRENYGTATRDSLIYLVTTELPEMEEPLQRKDNDQ